MFVEMVNVVVVVILMCVCVCVCVYVWADGVVSSVLRSNLSLACW